MSKDLNKKRIDLLRDIKNKFNSTIESVVECLNGNKKTIEYIYTDVIGKGTFGVVSSVKTKDDELMALKSTILDENYHNRELSVLKEINHKNITNLIYFNYVRENNGLLCLNLFLELGEINLEKCVSEKRVFSEKAVFGYLVQFLDALNYLENLGIVHRDIKPSNLLLCGKTVKICDFGCAKPVVPGSVNRSYICTRCYRAPENILGMTNYDTLIDVWALGLSLLELFTHKIVCYGESNEDQLTKILDLVNVSPEIRSKFKLEDRKCIGIENFVDRYVKCEKLKFFFSKSIVFDVNERWKASKLYEWAKNVV